ncbi:MAG: hypothetical protein EHM71_05200 [Zetaproteobacteria bacterium]|nr:MAG: hypothetical protein EHM71_05200 [Zetaproteobacteria bacterium]
MPIVTTTSKGQVLVPAGLRKRIGLAPGGKVLITAGEQNTLILEPVPNDPVEVACGFLAEGPSVHSEQASSLTQALMQEHREERIRDQAKRARLLRPARLPRKGARVRNRSRSAA